MSLIDRSFIGEGIIYGRQYQSQDALLPFGNCDAFNLRFATDRKTLANFMGGGGNRNVRERPTDVTGAIGMYDLTPTNIARVTRSTIKAIAAGTVTDEALACEAIEGELIPFKHLPDLSVAVTVKTASDTALVAGTDYLLTPHGVIVTGSSAITSAGIKATYTKLKASAVQMLNGSQVEMELFIAGLNDAQSGEPYSLRVRRAKFGMLQEFPVLGQDYVKLDGPVELLADPLVVATDISKFCEMTLLDKAA
ncbi:hypothetical protein M2318_005321 [Metapseudomonas resinovorans]|uniref:phage tail tube protein n=1 Tax=Metapseudomonas resinovorans TaxID=53412 RepID=UPI003D24612B